ncbi:MAG: hypothetical protein FWC40_06190 [Proteobacteria bacterium]|nr:hypothetical protein [Pseudomonadota bacterium]
MNKLLKLSMIAAMAIAVTACGDDKDNSAKCTSNAKQCNKGVPELCVNGEWKAQAACTDGKTCHHGECVSCTNDAKQCSVTGIPQLCTGGVWVDQTACTGEQSCHHGECVGGSESCINDAKQCSTTGIPQLCTGGTWVDQTACTDGKSCHHGECVGGSETCTNDERKCKDSTTPQLCSGGAWVDQAACTGGQSCHNGECTGGSETCANDEKKCKDSTTPQLCTGGVWVDQTACSLGQTCTGAGVCRAPEVGDPCNRETFKERCMNNAAYYCYGGKVEAWDCVENAEVEGQEDGRCIEDGTAWCAWLDADWYCNEDGEVRIENEYEEICKDFSEYGTIYFDSCHEIEGEMYIVVDRWADSVCHYGEVAFCVSDDEMDWVSCDECAFDGTKAMCI